MEPLTQQTKLVLFVDSLPTAVQNALGARNIDILMTVNSICSSSGFVLYEMGNICEGVRRVLSGEDTPSNLAAFIAPDKNIEEDNRPKIAALAQEIQQKIFDSVLPILKQAGFEIKEGRVPAAPVASPFAPTPSPISPTRPISQTGFTTQPPKAAPFSKGDTTTPLSPPLKGGEGSASVSRDVSRQFGGIDERHLRALLRITQGTHFSEDELRQKFEDLPEGLKRAITSVDTANAIQEIAKKHLLHIDQMGALASETGLVLLGLTHPVYFVANLTTRLRVPQNKALEIARDVSAQVLSKVKDALRGIHEKPASESTNVPNLRMDTNKTQTTPTTPVSPPRAGGEENSFLKVTSDKLPTSSTPYSAEAKWNIDTTRGLTQSSDNLRRGEERREITPPPSQLTTSNLSLKTNVGPTGWTRANSQTNLNGQVPPAQNSNTESRIPNIEKYQNKELENTQITTPSLPATPSPLPTPPQSPRTTFAPPVQTPDGFISGKQNLNGQASSPTTPPRGLGTPPQAPVVEPSSLRGTTGGEEGEEEVNANRNLTERKLNEPMSMPKTDTRYTLDPYREPLDS